MILKLFVTPKIVAGFNPEAVDVCFGFVMKVNSLRAKKENFTMSVPMVINIGRIKKAVPAGAP